MIRLNVNTFLGADDKETVSGDKAKVELESEPREVVCYCMYGVRRDIYIGFVVVFIACLIGTGVSLLMAWLNKNELYVGGIVAGCLSIILFVFYVYMNRVNRPEVRFVAHFEPSDAAETQPLLNRPK